ncbi:MAG: hypothetical protein U1E26_12325 [Coriobacteriia bacterium]|nr:hypothetical protein [Coriobacteriia bacterium]
MSMRRMRTAVLVVAATALALSTTGCQRLQERVAEEATEAAVEKATGGKAEIEDGSVSIETEDGTKLEAGTNRVPDDFPDNVPVDDDIKVVASASAPDGNRGTGYTLSYLTKIDTAKAIAKFKAGLVKEKWKIMMENETEGTAYLSAETNDQQMSATIAPAGEDAEDGYKTLISIVAVPRME